ncbi:MAG: HAMP domain-containing histidine kinase [Hyphomicrobiales bacterium]|nr:HAMP domain-containing histidine kinase [Hyphomicrobiales bacterium]
MTRAADEQTTERAGARPRQGLRLSTKLVALTALFVIVAEILVFVPSIAHFRINRLSEALVRADLVVTTLSGAPDPDRRLQDRLLDEMNASVISVRQGNMRRLVAVAETPPSRVDRTVDLEQPDAWRWSMAALAMLFDADEENIRVVGPSRVGVGQLDLVVSSVPIRAATVRFATNLAMVSAGLLALVAVTVFFVLRHMFVAPLARLTQAMARFAEDPEDPERIIRPRPRHDEIGDAERRLADLQTQVADSLAQKRHLADLGVAVSKINHDLRNMLAAAQLVTDRLSTAPDGTVQRFVPKLVATLDRAIGYSRAVLDYGKAGEAPPARRLIAARRLVEDVGEMLGLSRRDGDDDAPGEIAFVVDVDKGLEIDADPDQLFRVLLNLVRNARQALDADADPALVRRITVAGRRQGTVVTLSVVDTGPGVPQRARENLFRPFQGGVRAGGTGLGLAICAELVRAHGGTIELAGDGPGATFAITIADRVIDLGSVERKRRSTS